MYATWFINEYGDYGGRIAGAVLREPGGFTSDGIKAYLDRYFPPWSFTAEEMNDMTWSDAIMSPSDHARADFKQMMGALAGQPKQHDDPDNVAPMWRFGAIINARVMQIGLEEGFDWTTHIGTFPHKVLFLRGELNENMPLEHQQELASHYGSSQVITVLGTGHQQLWEKQDECLSHIRAYLADVGVSKSPPPGGAQ